ncbi:MAG: acyl-CoA dehydrogenase family protein [Acidimicrobiales bacterium]
MDFSLSPAQDAVADLADRIFSDRLTAERFKEVDAATPRFDRELWTELAKAGLLSVSVPEADGGGGEGFLATALMLEQAGKHAAPVPLLAATVLGALPIARFGSDEQRSTMLPALGRGELLVTAALSEAGSDLLHPATTAIAVDGAWRVSGAKLCVPAGAISNIFLVAASTADGGAGVFVVGADAPGVKVEPLITTTRDPEANVAFDGAPAERLGRDGEVLTWITLHGTAAMCSVMAGLCKRVVSLTAEYTKTREQFERPIASFQAVAQRAADAYIDAEAVQLTSRQAAWRLSEGLPASEEVAIAKFWASEGGQRVVHAAQHLHGGMGVDRDYPLHRFFLLAKQLELSLGGATAQLLKLGAILASQPASL